MSARNQPARFGAEWVGYDGAPQPVTQTARDAMRVPGSKQSLLQARADGADVRIVYSPHGMGHGIVVLDEPGTEKSLPAALNVCITDNEALARFLVDQFFCNFASFRGIDGKVRAFRNACRHRGMQVASNSGCTRAFVCRYHGWTYNLEGRLRHIPHAGQVFGRPLQVTLANHSQPGLGILGFDDGKLLDLESGAEKAPDLHLVVDDENDGRRAIHRPPRCGLARHAPRPAATLIASRRARRRR